MFEWLKNVTKPNGVLLGIAVLHAVYVVCVVHLHQLSVEPWHWLVGYSYLLLYMILVLIELVIPSVKQYWQEWRWRSCSHSMHSVRVILTLSMIGLAAVMNPNQSLLPIACFALPLVFLGFSWFSLSTAFLMAFWFVVGFCALQFLSDDLRQELSLPALSQSEQPDFWLDMLLLMVMVVLCGIAGWYFNLLKLALNNKGEQLQQALRVIQQLTVHEETTGLYTAQYMLDILNKQKQLVDRGDYQFVLAKVEIKDHQVFIDRYAQEVNIELIKFVATQLKNQLRTLDYCGRLDTHTYLILLTKTTVDKARAVIERIIQTVKQQGLLKLSIIEELNLSVGMTEYACIESTEDTLRRTDDALNLVRSGEEKSIGVVLSKTRQVELGRDKNSEST